MCSYPPPPPAPPLPPSLPIHSTKTALEPNSIKTGKSNLLENHTNYDSIIDLSSKTLDSYWNFITRNIKHEDFSIISLYNNVDPITQNGPTCGLVALAMCQSLVCDKALSVEQLYEKAKSMAFTNRGQMFSVSDMATLANTSLLVQTEIKYNLKEQLNELLAHLANGFPVLIPYDSDANHEPALKSGQRAHWATILGFCIAINSNDFIYEDYVCKIDQNNGQLIHLTTKQVLPHSFWNIIENKSYLTIFIYARQGKSKHLHLWHFGNLCESNANLVENSDTHKNMGAIIPSNGGIIQGLNNQSLFIKKRLLN